jgi:RNase P subunit RPR2
LQHCALYRRTIVLTCPSCQRVRRFDAVALWWLFESRRQDDTIPLVFRRFYCVTCVKDGQRIRPRWAITEDRPDEQQPPYPPERVWKRVVARYRS